MHIEDQSLGSVNYMMWGSNKLWVFIHKNSRESFLIFLERIFRNNSTYRFRVHILKSKSFYIPIKTLIDENIELRQLSIFLNFCFPNNSYMNNYNRKSIDGFRFCNNQGISYLLFPDLIIRSSTLIHLLISR